MGGQERLYGLLRAALGGLTSGKRPRERTIFSEDMALRGIGRIRAYPSTSLSKRLAPFSTLLPCRHPSPLRVVDAVSRPHSDPRRPPVPGHPDHPFRSTGKSGRLQAGMGGRLSSESVAAFASEA